MSRVYSVNCSDYERENVYKAVDDMIKLYGGIDKIAKKGETVFLKINLVIKKHPDEAATTHPMVIEAVSKRLVENGCRVIIGDSPGGPYNEKVLKGFYKVCGIEEAAKNSGAELNYDCSYSDYKTPDGCISRVLTMIDPPFKCDRIITISKLKTHSMAVYTGAVKVLFGMIPGVLKVEYHFKMPEIYDFSNLLVDICETVKPSFSIIDGVVAMEGDGPTAGVPKNVGLILASENPYELDVCGAHIMGLKVEDVPTLKRSLERGIIKGGIETVDVVGEDLDKYVSNFKVPKIRSVNFFRGRVPKRVEDFLTFYLSPRPEFSKDICVKCGVCVESCPPKALKMGDKVPSIDYKKCIRCFCCHELCPKKAINIKRPWILNRVFK
ncbi:MAG: (4Fe-4S)-binding protein [Caloramator sp.]|nr:MAG: (4Fe-4S)-binding protein [Caloramator sp.]